MVKYVKSPEKIPIDYGTLDNPWEPYPECYGVKHGHDWVDMVHLTCNHVVIDNKIKFMQYCKNCGLLRIKL